MRSDKHVDGMSGASASAATTVEGQGNIARPKLARSMTTLYKRAYAMEANSTNPAFKASRVTSSVQAASGGNMAFSSSATGPAPTSEASKRSAAASAAKASLPSIMRRLTSSAKARRESTVPVSTNAARSGPGSATPDLPSAAPGSGRDSLLSSSLLEHFGSMLQSGPREEDASALDAGPSRRGARASQTADGPMVRGGIGSSASSAGTIAKHNPMHRGSSRRRESDARAKRAALAQLTGGRAARSNVMRRMASSGGVAPGSPAPPGSSPAGGRAAHAPMRARPVPPPMAPDQE